MTQTGVVVERKENTVKIKVMRQSACEGCKQKKYCSGGDCSHEKPIFIEVQNTLGADVGDRGELCSDNRFVLGTAFAVFILPILLCFIVYGALSQNGVSEAICVGSAAAAFLLPFCGILFFLNRYVKKYACVAMRQIIAKK